MHGRENVRFKERGNGGWCIAGGGCDGQLRRCGGGGQRVEPDHPLAILVGLGAFLLRPELDRDLGACLARPPDRNRHTALQYHVVAEKLAHHRVVLSQGATLNEVTHKATMPHFLTSIFDIKWIPFSPSRVICPVFFHSLTHSRSPHRRT